MPRRKRRSNSQDIVHAGIILGVIALVVKVLSTPQLSAALGFSIVAACLAVVLLFGGRLLFRFIAAGEVNNAVADAVAAHMDELVRRRAQLLTSDACRTEQTARWEKEIAHFLSTQVSPSLTRRQRAIFAAREDEAAARVERLVAAKAAHRPTLSSLPPNATGGDFKRFCSDKLRAAGWDAHVTQGSRDQGVDVIATKNGVRVVLQCKLYSRPIGNKAVQEAAASRAYERAHYAAAVSSTAYTRDAEQLAWTNDVLLLHYSQLGELDRLLGLTGAGSKSK